MSQTCRPMVSYLYLFNLFWIAWCQQWLCHFFDKFAAVGVSSACPQTFSGMWHVQKHIHSCLKRCYLFGALLERHEQGQKDYLQQWTFGDLFFQLQKVIFSLYKAWRGVPSGLSWPLNLNESKCFKNTLGKNMYKTAYICYKLFKELPNHIVACSGIRLKEKTTNQQTSRLMHVLMSSRTL